MEPAPDAALLPGPQPAPTGHPRAAAHLLREVFPGDASLEDIDDPGQTGPVADPRAPAPPPRSSRRAREQGFDDCPEFVRDQGVDMHRGLQSQSARAISPAGA